MDSSKHYLQYCLEVHSMYIVTYTWTVQRITYTIVQKYISCTLLQIHGQFKVLLTLLFRSAQHVHCYRYMDSSKHNLQYCLEVHSMHIITDTWTVQSITYNIVQKYIACTLLQIHGQFKVLLTLLFRSAQHVHCYRYMDCSMHYLHYCLEVLSMYIVTDTWTVQSFIYNIVQKYIACTLLQIHGQFKVLLTILFRSTQHVHCYRYMDSLKHYLQQCLEVNSMYIVTDTWTVQIITYNSVQKYIACTLLQIHGQFKSLLTIVFRSTQHVHCYRYMDSSKHYLHYCLEVQSMYIVTDTWTVQCISYTIVQKYLACTLLQIHGQFKALPTLVFRSTQHVHCYRYMDSPMHYLQYCLEVLSMYIVTDTWTVQIITYNIVYKYIA